MPPTVADLLELPGLGLSVAAGRDGLDRPIRWVHTSELTDPTRWLSGGELLLTTGMGMKGSPAHQRSYLRRLVRAGLSGLGLGVGFGFDAVPAPIARAADREGFPVLEVPFQVPFIAIGEAVASSFAEDRMRELEMSEEIHDRLARLATLGSGPADILEEVVSMAPGWAYLFTLRGDVVAAASARAVEMPAASAVWSKLPPGFVSDQGPRSSSLLDAKGSVLALSVVSGKKTDGVVVFGRAGRPDMRDRLVVRHAVTVLALLLASRRAVAEVERRVAGDVLVEAVEGHLGGPQLQRRLELAGFPPGADVRVVVVELGEGAPTGLEDVAGELAECFESEAERARLTVSGNRIVALVVHPSPGDLVEKVSRELDPAVSDRLRFGIGQAVSLVDLKSSYLTATLALTATAGSTRIASGDDLGAYRLLMGAQPRPVLESFVRSVVGPLLDRDAERGSELFASVRAFVEAGARWEEGAAALGVHRHTLRYRIKQAQELLTSDLSSPEDRMEIWLACKATDLLSSKDD
jgi:purine catabolism regulator